MSIPLNINGTDYFYPVTGDVSWGPDATDWAVAVTSGMLQKAGGLFQLLAETDFGPNYGLKSLYYKSRTANPASVGTLRLAHADVISWRNNANDNNLSLSVDSSDQLLFNGNPIGTITSISDTNSIDLTLTGTDLSADLKLSSDTPDTGYQLIDLSIETDGLKAQLSNADIISAIPIADGSTTGLLSSTDWNTFNSKASNPMTTLGDIVVGGGSGVPNRLGIGTNGQILAVNTNTPGWVTPPAAITALTGDVVATGPGSVASTIQAGVITNSMISASAAIAFSKLAALTSGNILVGSAGNVATSVAMSGDVTIGNTGVTAIGLNKIINTMLAQMPTMTIKGNNTGGSADPDDLTATEVTAMLNEFVGDTGSGGLKGLVTTPAPGDETKFLKGDGTWGVPSGAGGANGFFGGGTDGNVTVTTPISLSRDMFYNDLTISGSGSINPNGYRIFVAGILDLTGAGAGAIERIGNNASGTAGAVVRTASNTILSTCSAGVAGGAGGINAGVIGGNGTSVSVGAGGASGGGFGTTYGNNTGYGGQGLVNGGNSPGSRGVVTTPAHFNRFATELIRGVTLSGGGAGSSGSGGGAGNTAAAAGGQGGGGGGGGGVIYIAANQIKTSGAAAGAISTNGGNGGNGANGAAGATGGGGGGCGGGGGFIYLLYGTKLDSAQSDVLTSYGGAGGTGGNSGGTSPGVGGFGGGSGLNGGIVVFCVTDSSCLFLEPSTVSYVAGSANSGGTGGAGSGNSTGSITF